MYSVKILAIQHKGGTQTILNPVYSYRIRKNNQQPATIFSMIYSVLVAKNMLDFEKVKHLNCKC